MGGEGRTLPAGACGVASQVVVPLRREAAWGLFTAGIAGWWPEGFATRGDATMVLDATVGGSLREEWKGGGGLEWYSVVGVDPGAWLFLAGDLTVAYGGPARSHVELRFDDASAGGTRVRLTDTLFAGATPALQASMEAGWKALLDAFASGAANAAAASAALDPAAEAAPAAKPRKRAPRAPRARRPKPAAAAEAPLPPLEPPPA
jgi:uncharacterized protein YndB with AHSA1/START domain